jgi:hypothetical protein
MTVGDSTRRDNSLRFYVSDLRPHNESEGAARRVLVQPRGSSLKAGFLGRIVERVRMLLINGDNLICQ